MHLRIVSALTGGFVATAFVALPASAHHGWSGQQQDQTEISGKVKTPVSLAGAHATMQIVDAEGKTWDITLAPAARTERAGLTAQTLAVGDEVTVRGNRNSDMSRTEIKTVRVTSAGKSYDVYPDRL